MRRYTLADLIEAQVGLYPEFDLGMLLPEVLKLDEFISNITFYGVTHEDIPNTHPLKKDESNVLFFTYIYPRYKDLFVCNWEEAADSQVPEDYRGVKKFASNFTYILSKTYKQYAYLIATLSEEYNSLLDEVKITTESKYLDTPQNIQGTFDWGSDDHLTNINKTVTSNELGTKMARLVEIENNLKDYYEKWSDEFRGLFIYE